MDDQPLGRRLALTSKTIGAHLDSILAEHDSSLTSWIVLHHAVEAASPGLSQRELADIMLIGGPALVRHIDRLEDQGLIRRTRDAHDRRIARVTPTPKGRRQVERLGAVMRSEDEAMRAVLTPSELKTLERTLDKLQVYVINRSTPLETDAS